VIRPAADDGGRSRATLARLPVPAATAASCLLAAGLLLAGCVTTVEPVGLFRKNVDATDLGGGHGPIATPIAIPIPSSGDEGERLLVEFYNGILQRLQTATEDGDIAMIDSLVAAYDKPDLPPQLKEHLRGYHGIARGLEFQRRVRNAAKLQLRGDDDEAGARRNTAEREPSNRPPSDRPPIDRPPILGEPLRLQMRLPASDVPVQLGGSQADDPVGFSVVITIDDEYADGGSRSTENPHVVWLPATFDLAGDAVLTLPIDVDVPAGDAVRRTVGVRVDLMPGYVRYGDVRAPVHMVALGSGEWVQWPKGYEVLAKTPLRALRTALQAFTPNNFASAYLAAMLVPDAQRADANALLIDQVRFGKVDQVQVATAALARTNPNGPRVGDRDAWLSWWQRQR